MSKFHKKLDAARVNQSYVQVARSPKYATAYLEGFVVEVGKSWVLLAQTRDGGWPNGYVAFRLRDVTSLRSSKGISERFARLQPCWPPTHSFNALNLDDAAGVITSLSAGGELIGIEQEFDRSAMWVGEVEDLWPKWVWLDEVDFTGTWLDKPLGYRLRKVTAVTTGTPYFEALRQVSDPRGQKRTGERG